MYGCSDSNSQPYDSNKEIIKNQRQVPALGVPVPSMKLAADVRTYIRNVLAAPLPSDYKLPADMLVLTDYDSAVVLVGKHFPEFNGLEAEGLLSAVKANPFKYQEMILEARSIRKHFFPAHQH